MDSITFEGGKSMLDLLDLIVGKLENGRHLDATAVNDEGWPSDKTAKDK